MRKLFKILGLTERSPMYRMLRDMRNSLRQLCRDFSLLYWRYIVTPSKIRANRGKANRHLEIGPGPERLPDFETLSIVKTPAVDYVWDATSSLPFEDNTFSVIYASHVLEHVPWYFSEKVLQEWTRILAPGGVIELWVPDAEKVAEAFLAFEKDGVDNTGKDGWYRFNPEKDVCVWYNGRTFSYGDGTGNPLSENWHRASLSRRYLRMLMEKSGLAQIKELSSEDVRGDDHGWISLGLSGVKAQ